MQVMNAIKQNEGKKVISLGEQVGIKVSAKVENLSDLSVTEL